MNGEPEDQGHDTRDKYDLAIEYLANHPQEIIDAWGDPDDHEAGCLFQYATRSENVDWNVGCLTQIRRDSTRTAATRELTREIRTDERIPLEVAAVEVDDLYVFAEWQRRLDKELGA